MRSLMKLIEKYIGKDKNITNLIIILIIGIIILIAGSAFMDKGKKADAVPHELNDISAKQEDKLSYEHNLKINIEQILSLIEGVGEVSVMVTLNSTAEIIPAVEIKNNQTITKEEDNQGGKREVTQTEEENKVLVLNKQGGEQQPLILKELKPEVKGVIIVAEGVSDPKVKFEVYEAVKAILGIKAHQVKVFERTSEFESKNY
jgi:stage III sporulation protein AG